MKKLFTDLSRPISLTCILASTVSALPVSAAQMSFDDTASSGLATPLVSEACALRSEAHLKSQLAGKNARNTSNLRPNLLASRDLGAAQGGLMSASPSFEDDCCAVGGIEAVGGPLYNGGAFCDLGGVPPAGGIAAPSPGGFPFPVLAALAPAAGVPLLLGGEATPRTQLPSGPKSSPASTPKPSPKGQLASNPKPGPKNNPSANPGPKSNPGTNPSSSPSNPANPKPGPVLPPGPATPTTGPTTEKAPEPSTMAGLLIGGAMFGAYRKRKRSSGV